MRRARKSKSMLTPFDPLMDSILVTWAGANNVASGSRGGYMDARQLTALEAFMGESLGKYPGRKAANDREWRVAA